jgi:hypothetical protein
MRGEGGKGEGSEGGTGGKGEGSKGEGGKGKGDKGGKGSTHPESIILSAPPTESMMLSAPFDCVITYLHAMVTNTLTAVWQVATKKQQSAILTIADLQLSSTVPQRRR